MVLKMPFVMMRSVSRFRDTFAIYGEKAVITSCTYGLQKNNERVFILSLSIVCIYQQSKYLEQNLILMYFVKLKLLDLCFSCFMINGIIVHIVISLAFANELNAQQS
eukprot:c22016_g3_i1 orf=457-777(+)